MPYMYSFGATLMLLYMNIFSVIMTTNFFKPFFHLANKLYVLILMLLLAVFNYLVLYRGRYYTEVFDRFDNESERYKSWNKYVPIYIIVSVLFMLIVLEIADYQHDGHL